MTWNSSNLPYTPPRLTAAGYDYECSLSTLSPRPSQVTNLELISYTIRQFDITLITMTLRWSPPKFPNGILAPYNICVGVSPLDPTQEPQTDNIIVASRHFCGTIKGYSNGTVQLVYLDRGDHENLYVQVSLMLLHGDSTMLTIEII